MLRARVRPGQASTLRMCGASGGVTRCRTRATAGRGVGERVVDAARGAAACALPQHRALQVRAGPPACTRVRVACTPSSQHLHKRQCAVRHAAAHGRLRLHGQGPRTHARRAYVYNMCVRAQHRRRGVARALVQACIRTARLWGADSLWLHVQKTRAGAIQLYTNQGFAAVSARCQQCSGHGEQP